MARRQRQMCIRDRGEAVMVLSIDDPVPDSLLKSILEVEGINSANPVTL